jgi:hypothetical protein
VACYGVKKNLRKLPPCICIAGVLNRALKKLIPYKAEIFLEFSFFAENIRTPVS